MTVFFFIDRVIIQAKLPESESSKEGLTLPKSIIISLLKYCCTKIKLQELPLSQIPITSENTCDTNP